MAVYTDSQLNTRIDDTLPTNHAGAIDAAELKALLKDINDSKVNIASAVNISKAFTIDGDTLVNGETTIDYVDFETDFPVIFLKSPGVDGDIWSAINFSYGPSTSGSAWIHIEEDLAAGTILEGVVVKFR